jgi:hypothetical protein
LENDGTPKPAFFKDNSGLSTDLAILSTKEKSKSGYTNPPRWPEESGLVEILVGKVRRASAKAVDIKHDPLVETKNYSHTLFTGGLSTAQAKKLKASASMCVKPRFEKK